MTPKTNTVIANLTMINIVIPITRQVFGNKYLRITLTYKRQYKLSVFFVNICVPEAFTLLPIR